MHILDLDNDGLVRPRTLSHPQISASFEYTYISKWRVCCVITKYSGVMVRKLWEWRIIQWWPFQFPITSLSLPGQAACLQCLLSNDQHRCHGAVLKAVAEPVMIDGTKISSDFSMTGLADQQEWAADSDGLPLRAAGRGRAEALVGASQCIQWRHRTFLSEWPHGPGSCRKQPCDRDISLGLVELACDCVGGPWIVGSVRIFVVLLLM